MAEPEPEPAQCVDTNGDLKDKYGNGCDFYVNGKENYCGFYNGYDGFFADQMCCNCGGGDGPN